MKSKKNLLMILVAVVVIAAVVLGIVLSNQKGNAPEETAAPVTEITAEVEAEPTEEPAPADEKKESAAPAAETTDNPIAEATDEPAVTDDAVETSAQPEDTAENNEGDVQEAADENPVLFTVGEHAFTLNEVNDTLLDMYANSYVGSMADYDTAIEYLVQMEIIKNKIAELGLDQYTAEEEEAFAAEAQTQWDEAIQTYIDYFLTEDTEEAKKQIVIDAENYYAAYGFSKEVLIEQAKWNDALEKLQKQSVSVTEEEVKASFDSYVEQYKSMFEGNVPMYEYYQYYNGTEMLYTPEGYRGIIHILLTVDDALLEAYNTAKATLEEQHAAEELAEGVEPVTEEDVLAAYAAIIATRQAEIDDIYAKLEQGETFESLIALYGTDPGMEDSETLANGYAVHKDSIIYDPVFTTAAFSDKMQQVGDVSDPVVGMYGIHILKYHRDIPAGGVELSAELHDTLESSMISEKFAAKLGEWAEGVVVYNQEAIDAAKAEAIAEETAEEQQAAEEADAEVSVADEQPEEASTAEEAPAEGTAE